MEEGDVLELIDVPLSLGFLRVGVPEGWQTSTDEDGSVLVAVEVAQPPSSVVVTHAEATAPPATPPDEQEDPVAAVLRVLGDPVLLDEERGGGELRVLVSHVRAGTALTTAQRRLTGPRGTVTATVTVSSSRWADLHDVADAVLAGVWWR